jgi:hypothetical protein
MPQSDGSCDRPRFRQPVRRKPPEFPRICAAAPKRQCLGSGWTGLVWSLLTPGPICPGSIWGVLIWTGLICGSNVKVVVRNAWGVLSHRSNSLSKAKTRPLAAPGTRCTGKALSFSHRRTVLSSRPKKAAISFHESRRRSGGLVALCATERPAEPQMKEGNARLCPLMSGFVPCPGKKVE